MKTEDALAVVAIDFGTTYSGYAYSFKSDFKTNHGQIRTVNWESGDGLCTPKTPTSILFDKAKNIVCFGYEAERKYADLSEDGEADDYFFFSNFKMKLFQKESELSEEETKPRVKKHLKISRQLVIKDNTGKPMEALKVFSETIRFMKDEFLHSSKHPVFKEDEIHWVLTIPAIWKDNAKQFMREAALLAGIKDEKLSLVYEPEAAAVFCKDMVVQRFEDELGITLIRFQPGQQFMVLDCGGGTIDVTLHEIQFDSSLKELERPSGGPWGGTYVDKEFVELLKDLFGSKTWSVFIKEEPHAFLDISRQFEMRKKCLTLKSTTNMSIPLPPSLLEIFSRIHVEGVSFADMLEKSEFAETVDYKRGKLVLKPGFSRTFFHYTIEKILSHVKKLLSHTHKRGNRISTIMLAGGYPNSPILQERVSEEFADLNVICAEDSDLTVLKGAVMLGHNPKLIIERKCPRTYGISVNVPFDARKHPYTHKLTVEGFDKCTDVFRIMVRKGDSLIVGKTSFTISCNPSYSNDSKATVEVYESTSENPLYTSDKGVNNLGSLVLSIPNVVKGKSRIIKTKMHFGYTELFVTVSEEETDRKVEAKFDCLMV